MKLSKVFGILAISAISLAASVPAYAGFAQGNAVTLGGQPVFTIPGSAEGFSPDHRAWMSQDALDNALVLSSDKTASAVTVARENGACVVMLGGRRIATADENSARLEGMTVDQLANKWADGIKNFLSNQSQAQAYIATLTGKNPINAQVAIVERRIYAPQGTVLPVAFTTELNSETMQAGQTVQGTLVREVAFGNYVIPQGATVIGTVNEAQPGLYNIAFNTLRLANGTAVPIAATLTTENIKGMNVAPHLVVTQNLPHGTMPRYQGQVNTAARVPSQIGIGTLGGGINENIAFRRGSNLIIAAGEPMSLVFNTVTPVAVMLRTGAM